MPVPAPVGAVQDYRISRTLLFLPGLFLIGLETFIQFILLVLCRLHLVQHLRIGAGQQFLQVGQLLFIHFRLRLLAQVLHTTLESQARLARLALLQGLLAKVVEELDVQQHQDMTDFLDPLLGLAGGQEAFLGGAGYLVVQRFKQKTHVLGLGLGLDRVGGLFTGIFSPRAIRPSSSAIRALSSALCLSTAN